MERADFLVGYAEKYLGRALTEEEQLLVRAEVNRRKVQELCATFAQKPKSKAKKPAKKTAEPVEKVVKSDEV